MAIHILMGLTVRRLQSLPKQPQKRVITAQKKFLEGVKDSWFSSDPALHGRQQDAVLLLLGQLTNEGFALHRRRDDLAGIELPCQLIRGVDGMEEGCTVLSEGTLLRALLSGHFMHRALSMDSSSTCATGLPLHGTASSELENGCTV